MGKGIVKLGEGKWATKDGKLLAAKETNRRFKNAEFTVARGTRATYVGKDGLIKESNLQDVNLVPSIITTQDNNGGVINYISSNIYSSTSDGTSTSSIRPKFDFNTTNGNRYKLVITPTGAITGTVNFDFHDGSSYLFQDYDFTTTKEIYFTDNGNVFGSFDGQQTYSIDSFTISVQEIKTDTPRIDFTDNTDGHLLLEPQSTNLITYSEDFTTWTTTGTANVTPNTSISPDGTQNASTLNIVDATYFYKSILTGSGTFTLSCYVKVASGTNDFKMQSYSGTDGANVSSVFTATTEWQRFEHTVTVTVDSNFYPVFISSPLTGGEFQIWGAQLEELSYPTSYIPTNGSTVTRDAETCTGAGEAIDFNSEEGVLYAEIAALADTSSYRFITLSDGTTQNRVALGYHNVSNTIRGFVYSGNSIVCTMSYAVTDIKDFHKAAIKYKLNDFALWVDGVERGVDGAGAAPIGLDTLQFNSGGGSSVLYSKCKAIRVYKEALSDTDLQNLTS